MSGTTESDDRGEFDGLLGLYPRQKNGIADMLVRLGEHNYAQAMATLSIDTNWQAE